MISMRSMLVVLVSLGLVLGATAVHGSRTDRWGPNPALEQAGDQLERLPRELGDWVGTDQTLNENQLRIGEIAGYLAREYVHRPTGDRATVLIVYGRVGGIGAHPPDVCYRGAGFEIAEKPTPLALPQVEAGVEFLSLRASKNFPQPEALSVWWAWSGDLRGWTTPVYPRLHYALSPVLYKLYFIRNVPLGSTPETDKGLPAAQKLCLDVLRSLRPAP
jgi:hypothetical protein